MLIVYFFIGQYLIFFFWFEATGVEIIRAFQAQLGKQGEMIGSERWQPTDVAQFKMGAALLRRPMSPVYYSL